MNPKFITFIVLFINIAYVIYWYYVRPYWHKKIIKNYYNLKRSNTLISKNKNKNSELRKNLLHQLETQTLTL